MFVYLLQLYRLEMLIIYKFFVSGIFRLNMMAQITFYRYKSVVCDC